MSTGLGQTQKIVFCESRYPIDKGYDDAREDRLDVGIQQLRMVGILGIPKEEINESREVFQVGTAFLSSKSVAELF